MNTLWQVNDEAACDRCGTVEPTNRKAQESNNPAFPVNSVWCQNDLRDAERAQIVSLPTKAEPSLQSLLDQIINMQGALDELVLDNLLNG